MWLSLLFALSVTCCASGGKLKEVYSWNIMDIVWPSSATRDAAIKSRQYIPENNLPVAVEIWHDKLFITVPRWKKGIPATLAYIPLNETCGHQTSPALIPYPNLEDNTLPKDLHEYDECSEEEPVRASQLISVFRARVDSQDRLWVLDTGTVNLYEESEIKVAKPALLIYDLKTDKLIRRYTFKDSDYMEKSLLTHLVLDSRDCGDCGDTIAYVSDLHGSAILVYSFNQNESWRIEHNYFHSDPLTGEYDVGGVKFYWADGVTGVSLSPVHDDGSRTVYFHPGSSTKQFAVSTTVLLNATYGNSPDAFHEFKLLGDRGHHTEVLSSWLDQKTGVIFYTEVNKDSITCWNTKKPLIEQNMGLVESDHERFIFPEDIMIDTDRNMWVVTNNAPQYLFKTINPHQVNYRIFKVKVEDAIAGTPCESCDTSCDS